MDLSDILKRCKDGLIDLKTSIVSVTDSAQINFGNPSPKENVPLYLVMDFAVKGRESEDDYGLCLSITFQHYDPEKGLSKYWTEDLYAISDLTRGDGQFISSFGPEKIKPGANFSFDLGKTIEGISQFIKDQKETIITTLASYKEFSDPC